MTVETKKSVLVPNDELLDDIGKTELEIKAFQMISEGFQILADDPDGKERRTMNSMKSAHYARMVREGQQLLARLQALKTERGL